MKTIKKIFIGLAVSVVSLVNSPINTFAGQSSFSKDRYDASVCLTCQSSKLVYTLATDKDSALADGKDTIKVTYTQYDTLLNDIAGNEFAVKNDSSSLLTDNGFIFITGTGNKLACGNWDMKEYTRSSARLPDSAYSITHTYYLTSSVAGNKVITAKGAKGPLSPVGCNPRTDFNNSELLANVTSPLTVSFTGGSTSTSVARQVQNQKTVEAVSTKPDAPSLSTINSIDLPDSKIFTQSIRLGTPIVLSGTSTPNSTIKLTIYSDPITAETKSDASGIWSYTLAEALPVGDHRVEAQITDPTGAVSNIAEIARFSIKPAVVPVQPEIITSPNYILTSTVYILCGLALILSTSLVYLIFKRKRKLAETNHQVPQPS